MDQTLRWMADDLALAGRAPETCKIYLACARDFARFHGQSPRRLGQREVRAWVAHLKTLPISPQRVHQHLTALAFLYRRTLGRPQAVSFLAWPRLVPKLPVVLSLQEVQAVLEAAPAPVYRLVFLTMIATGFRIREACRLRREDLDPALGVIRTVGKGGIPRQVPLHGKLLRALEAHCREAQPTRPWLFTGQRGLPLDLDHTRRVFRAACRASGLGRRATPHALRHTYATFLLESGTNLRVIQALLGHGSLVSTQRYLQVSTRVLAEAPSPLDQLDLARVRRGTPGGRPTSAGAPAGGRHR